MKVAILNVKLDTSNINYCDDDYMYINPIYHTDCIFTHVKYEIKEYDTIELNLLYSDYTGCDIYGFTLNHYSLTDNKKDLAYLLGINNNENCVIIPIHNLETIIDNIEEIITHYLLRDIIREFYATYLVDERQKKLNFIECI